MLAPLAGRGRVWGLQTMISIMCEAWSSQTNQKCHHLYPCTWWKVQIQKRGYRDTVSILTDRHFMIWDQKVATILTSKYSFTNLNGMYTSLPLLRHCTTLVELFIMHGTLAASETRLSTSVQGENMPAVSSGWYCKSWRLPKVHPNYTCSKHAIGMKIIFEPLEKFPAVWKKSRFA